LPFTSDRPPEPASLRTLLAAREGLRLEAPAVRLDTRELLSTTIFGGRRRDFSRKSALIAVKAQIDCARALIELDGIAARLVISPPDFSKEKLESALAQAEVDVVIADDPEPTHLRPVIIPGAPIPSPVDTAPSLKTQWVMPTSGTTGAPKLVAHSLATLLGPATAAPLGPAPVWATFYDIRRYGGLQIFLRACACGAPLVLSDPDEAQGDFLARAQAAGVTHISGTPSHWRRLLMSPEARLIDPAYIRLSGEIADRAILSALRGAFPRAKIVHAYASTEAGVGFEVHDEREGFPAALLDGSGPVEMRLQDGSLRIRSPRTARRYVGRPELALCDAEGFVDTGDIVEKIGDRCFFRGRRAGIINVGGLKAHPEEIEEVINAHPQVRMCRVSGRRNPITGGLVIAEVVLDDAGAGREKEALQGEIMQLCRDRLARHKTPATIRFVPQLDMLASGKMARRHA